MTMPKGAIVIDAFLQFNLSDSAVGKPITLTPDVWYGVNDDVTVGLVHSSLGATGVLGSIASGGSADALCLTGSGSGCTSIYNKVGGDVRYRLKAPFAFDGGIYANSISPFHLSLKVGIDGRWRFDKISVEVQPNLFIGVTGRGDARANADVLTLPGTASYMIDPKIELAGQLAIVVPFENTGTLYAVGLAVAARYHPEPRYGVGLIFALPAVVGGGSLTGVDARTLVIGGSYAM